MSVKSPLRFHLNVALCLAAMTAVAALILWWAGLSPLTALAVAFAIACPVAALYAWRLSRRALRPLDNAGRSDLRRTS